MSAVFSHCRRYRYRLDREIDSNGTQTYAFFGINPSDADEKKNDPTVSKMLTHARNNGAKHCIVGNVFSWVDKDVNVLATLSDPLGQARDKHHADIIKEADVIVVCWGNRDKVPDSLHHHFDTLLSVLKVSGKPVMCLKKNKNGDPGHPLYISLSTPLIPFFD